MTSTSIATMNPIASLAEYRQKVTLIRERALQLYQGGATGAQVAAGISSGTDEFLQFIIGESLAHLPIARQNEIREQSALVAVGGSGREEPAPYSDVDLLFLYRPAVRTEFRECTTQVVQNCWDSKLKLGHTIQTPREALSHARNDIHFATGLTEARLVWGSESLLEELLVQFRKQIARRKTGFLREALAARLEEREKNGPAVCQLEPDLKRSFGGLRDIHLIRWYGFACYGTTDLNSLRLRDALRKSDYRKLIKAQEHLLRIRMSLHFQTGRPEDLLTRDEQLRIAEELQVKSEVGKRPVEQFMQIHFRHTSAIAEISSHFVKRHEPRTITDRFKSLFTTHNADSIFRVNYDSIDVLPASRESLASNLGAIVKLFHTAVLNGVQVKPELLEYLQQNSDESSPQLTDDIRNRFLDILSRSANLGQTLRAMWQARVLEKIIPQSSHMRALLQFNQYHSYTVDEHTFRAIEAAESFSTDEGSIGKTYRRIKRKRLLHLALFLHDMGKGYEEDHSEVGARLAEEVAIALKLPQHHRDVLVFLVHKHLQMAHLAFRRNYTDPEILFEFSHEVGSPETLRMLFVLTAADMTAVGPGVWNDWKEEVLTDLFNRAMLILGGKAYYEHEVERKARIRKDVIQRLGGTEFTQRDFGTYADDTYTWEEWIDEHLDYFTPLYLSTTTNARIAADLDIISALQPDDIKVRGEYDPETDTVNYRVITYETLRSGCFHRIAGALTYSRHEILAAEITTTDDQIVVDRFHVIDKNFEGQVPEGRIQEVGELIARALRGDLSSDEMLRKLLDRSDSQSALPTSDLEPRVVIDNKTSETCSVIDIFAHDRPGLLFAIARQLFQLDLSVELAKISTHLDQVVDVFYVTTPDGEKIRDGERLLEIRDTLLNRVKELT